MQVIELDAFRKKEEVKPQPSDVYECLRCHGDSFVVFANGVICCRSCKARMRNLLAVVNVLKA